MTAAGALGFYVPSKLAWALFFCGMLACATHGCH